jgi:hypothetical protein
VPASKRVRYPGRVTNPSPTPAVRRVARVLALTPAAVLVTNATAAFASAPEQWGEEPQVDAMHALLIFLIIPLGLAAVIWLLTYLPSMMRGDSAYQPGLAWRHEPEWFGGPRDGLEKADRAGVEGADTRGGASGHW